MPDCSDCMISAPRMAPWIVPIPPESAVPPITAAAITRSSSSVPMSLEWKVSRAEATTAEIAQSAPMMAKTFTVSQRMLMPGQRGRFRVAAGGEDVAAKPGLRGDHRHDDGHEDQHAAPNRDAIGLGVALRHDLAAGLELALHQPASGTS